MSCATLHQAIQIALKYYRTAGPLFELSFEFDETGLVIGMKPAGGIRTAKQAIQYLCVLHETLGIEWMTPDLFRFGASSLLNDVLLQLRKQRTGIYRSPDEFTLD